MDHRTIRVSLSRRGAEEVKVVADAVPTEPILPRGENEPPILMKYVPTNLRMRGNPRYRSVTRISSNAADFRRGTVRNSVAG